MMRAKGHAAFCPFMIACWLIFALSATSSLVGWAGADYYQLAQAAEACVQTNQQPSLDNGEVILEPESQAGPLANWALAQRQTAFLIVAIAGGYIAAGLLLWNVLLHSIYRLWRHKI